MKEQALKLADELEKDVRFPDKPDFVYTDVHRMYASQMIRRLVEELDATEKAYKWTEIARNAPTKPLSDDEIENMAFNFVYEDDELDIFAFARAIEERHGIK